MMNNRTYSQYEGHVLMAMGGGTVNGKAAGGAVDRCKIEDCILNCDEVTLSGDCNITQNDVRIIEAMIEGKFNCSSCVWLGPGKCQPTDPEEFCSGWQEREER